MSRFALINLQGGLSLAEDAASCVYAPVMLILIDSFHVEFLSHFIDGTLIHYSIESTRLHRFFSTLLSLVLTYPSGFLSGEKRLLQIA